MNSQTRILCVDDEKNVLRALERIFLDDDYEILTAGSGEEGLEILASTPVQVVISDYRMPGMNGVEFLKKVCADCPDTIRIVLSGYADTAAVVAAINEGKIYKFIPKPWNDDELRVTVAKALETFAIQRRNRQLGEELQRKNEELSALNENLERMAMARASEPGATPEVTLFQAQRILEELPFGVLSVDENGVVRQMNRAAAHILRLDPDLLGQPVPAGVKTEVVDPVYPGFGRTVLEWEGARLEVRASPWPGAGEAGVVITLYRI